MNEKLKGWPFELIDKKNAPSGEGDGFGGGLPG